MDLQNTDLRGGTLQISTEVIAKIARCAALEIDGVAEVSCGSQNKKLRSLLETSSIQPPVTVEMRGEYYASPDGALWRTHPCHCRKSAGEREERGPEHDQCHGQPCEPCHRWSC